MMNRIEAEKLCADLVKMREGATDQEASAVTGVYPFWKVEPEKLIKAGTKIQHKGKILKAAVDWYATETNSPDKAPTLWEELQYKDGIRIIPETITVISAFSKGEQGWWEDKIYESLADNNIYTPTAYPQNWKKIIEPVE